MAPHLGQQGRMHGERGKRRVRGGCPRV
jgi:hypothetical protein